MHQFAKNINPQNDNDLVWKNAFTPTEVQAVTDFYNSTDYEAILSPLRSAVQTDETTGLKYICFGTVSKEVIVHCNPFANPLDDNMLMRADYLKRVFESVGIQLPLISFAAPGASKGVKVSRTHHKSTAKGNFDELAKLHLQTLVKHNISSVRVIGFSQGATMAASLATQAPQFGISVTHVVIGEPANVVRRTRRQLAKHFKVSADIFNQSLDDSGINHSKKFYLDPSMRKFFMQLASQARLNFNIVGGLAKPTFAHNLRRILDDDAYITISWGSINNVSPAGALKKIINESRVTHAKHIHAIHTIELIDQHHTWADQLNVLATFYVYGLLRA